ncbi:MAG: NERD domain-containing protein [Asgard group archaeon]|nr:NERD domain-containing protein [Asgard group archaeon]
MDVNSNEEKGEKTTDNNEIEDSDENKVEKNEEENNEEEDEKFDKEEYIYNKLIKKRNHVYTCIANVLKNYDREQVISAFIPEREKIALKLASILMKKDGLNASDFSNVSTATSTDDKSVKTNEIINLSAINFLINQMLYLTAEDEGEMEFSKDAKQHLMELALDWARLRDQAFMFSNGMIKLEYELHEELVFVETELYHETEKKLRSIGIDQKSIASSKLKEMRDQRRKMSDRTVFELVDLVKSWHSEIAYLRRITEFYASMRQLNEEEIEALSILFENFGALMALSDLKNPFKEIKMSDISKLRDQKESLHPTKEMQLLIYETLMKFALGEQNVPYFLSRIVPKKDENYLQIPIISLLLFSRFCNSYSEMTRSKKAHDLELIVSEISSLSGWIVVDQNVEILSEGDTVTEIDIIIRRNKRVIIIEVKDLALWRGWYFDRESLIKRYEIFATAVKKLRERRLLLKHSDADLLIVTALTERWKKVEGIPIVPLKSLHKYLKKLKRLESSRSKSKR